LNQIEIYFSIVERKVLTPNGGCLRFSARLAVGGRGLRRDERGTMPKSPVCDTLCLTPCRHPGRSGIQPIPRQGRGDIWLRVRMYSAMARSSKRSRGLERIPKLPMPGRLDLLAISVAGFTSSLITLAAHAPSWGR